MTTIDKERLERISLNGVARLSRNNVEIAGLAMYFVALAFFFAFAFILMVFRLGPGTREKAASDRVAETASLQR
jgi:hypothetical protein